MLPQTLQACSQRTAQGSSQTGSHSTVSVQVSHTQLQQLGWELPEESSPDPAQ